MDTALSEINSFIANIVPFDQLTEVDIDKVTRLINIIYVTKNKSLGDRNESEAIYLVRKGALSYFDANGELLGMFGEGDVCTVFINDNQIHGQYQVTTEEDCLLYVIDYQALTKIIKPFPLITSFFIHSAETLLSNKINQLNEEAVLASTLINSPIEQFYNSPVATISADQTIKAAAQIMAEKNYSCLVIAQTPEQIEGIITDKDICRRCVAQGLNTENPVSKIMTSNIVSLDIQANAYEAILLMTAKRIHHLPITNKSQLVGMVSMTDLINHESQNALNITSMINKAKRIEELTDIGQLLPKLQQRMTRMGATAQLVGKSISAITMALTSRLIQMFEQTNGQAPVPFAWLGAGSEARREQLAHSDQDNALMISNEMQPNHQAWFSDLATFVCDGLNQCGFVYCPGDVMATNPKWRQTQKVWQQYFDNWVELPNPKALLHSSIFFDIQTVYGDSQLLEQVRANLLNKTVKNSLFIAHLSANALSFRPPLGFFRDFVLIGSGEHKETIDIKHYGITPIVDLARIYALSEGIAASNTVERLKQAAGTPSLSKGAAASLIDAYEFLTTLRMEHHSKLYRQRKTPDHYLYPKQLSRLEREHLKAAFKVIKTQQDVRQKTL